MGMNNFAVQRGGYPVLGFVKDECTKNIIVPEIYVNGEIQEFETPVTDFDTLIKVTGITTGTSINLVEYSGFTDTAILINTGTTFNNDFILSSISTALSANVYLAFPEGVINLNEFNGSALTPTITFTDNYESFRRNTLHYDIFKLNGNSFSGLTYSKDIDQMEFGTELITNGDFDGGGDGWWYGTVSDGYGAGTWSFSGNATMYGNVNEVNKLYQVVGVTSGVTHMLNFDVSNFKSGKPFHAELILVTLNPLTDSVYSEINQEYYFNNIRVKYPPLGLERFLGLERSILGNGNYFREIVPSSSAITLTFYSINNRIGIDNVSLKESEPTTPYNDDIPINVLSQGEFILKPSYKFNGDSMPIGFTKSYNTKDFSFTGSQYSLYDETYDWYWAAVNNPDLPSFIVDTEAATESIVTNENLTVEVDGQSSFILKQFPANIIALYLNGVALFSPTNVTLLEDDFRLNNNPFLSCCGDADFYIKDNQLFTNNIAPFNLNLLTTDTLVLSYIGSPQNERFMTESVVVDSVISGTSNTTNAKIFFNTNTNKYEYYLKSGVREKQEVLMFKNGLALTPEKDFYLCDDDLNKVIFHTTKFIDGDIIYTYYEGGEEILTTISGVTLTWETVIGTEEGLFITQVTDTEDINFTGWTASGVTAYNAPNSVTIKTPNIGLNNLYTSTINFPIDVNKTYKARIFNFQSYETLGGTKIITGKIGGSLQFRGINNSINVC